MGAFSYSGTAASNTTVDGIGAAGSDSPDNIDNLVRALAASDANLVRDLGGANTVAGSADAITVALADASTPTYFDGMTFSFRAASDTTVTGPTLNVDSLGAKTIKKTIAGVESALVAGDIQAGGTYQVVYRSAWASAAGAFELLNPESFTKSLYPAVTVTAANQTQARNNISAALKGHIFGLEATQAADADHDLTFAIGEAASTETNPVLMKLTSSLTKQFDATWAVGDAAGGMQSGSALPTSGTVHVHLMERSDTGVVDIIGVPDGTTLVLPSGYDRSRRIMSFRTDSSANVLDFYQQGDAFIYKTIVTDRNSTSAVYDTLLTLTVPLGIKVYPLTTLRTQQTSGSSACGIGSGDIAALTFNATTSAVGITNINPPPHGILTNTSGQVRYYFETVSGTTAAHITYTLGYIDLRGRLGGL
jgi:hypothetical protein